MTQHPISGEPIAATDTEPQSRICCDAGCTQQGRLGCPLFERAKQRAADEYARAQEAAERRVERHNNVWLVRLLGYGALVVVVAVAVISVVVS